jgi:hypothetical protein
MNPSEDQKLPNNRNDEMFRTPTYRHSNTLSYDAELIDDRVAVGSKRPIQHENKDAPPQKEQKALGTEHLQDLNELSDDFDNTSNFTSFSTQIQTPMTSSSSTTVPPTPSPSQQDPMPLNSSEDGNFFSILEKNGNIRMAKNNLALYGNTYCEKWTKPLKLTAEIQNLDRKIL